LTFDSFYRATWEDVYRSLAATIRDPDLAAEAVDEAMMRAYVRWSKISQASNPTGWVYRVAYRWAIDRLRRRATEQRLLPRLFRRSETQAEIEPGLDGALAGLSDGQRAVVVLAYAFEWTEQEIAEVLGLPPGTVKSRLHRGLAALRKEIGV
jgi:RNA polymerase sigma-70 factor (ECF subfamily)